MDPCTIELGDGQYEGERGNVTQVRALYPATQGAVVVMITSPYSYLYSGNC